MQNGERERARHSSTEVFGERIIRRKLSLKKKKKSLNESGELFYPEFHINAKMYFKDVTCVNIRNVFKDKNLSLSE